MCFSKGLKSPLLPLHSIERTGANLFGPVLHPTSTPLFTSHPIPHSSFNHTPSLHQHRKDSLRSEPKPHRSIARMNVNAASFSPQGTGNDKPSGNSNFRSNLSSSLANDGKKSNQRTPTPSNQSKSFPAEQQQRRFFVLFNNNNNRTTYRHFKPARYCDFFCIFGLIIYLPFAPTFTACFTAPGSLPGRGKNQRQSSSKRSGHDRESQPRSGGGGTAGGASHSVRASSSSWGSDSLAVSMSQLSMNDKSGGAGRGNNKKNQVSLNHLLNFSFPVREEPQNTAPVRRRRNVNYQPFNKEKFINAK